VFILSAQYNKKVLLEVYFTSGGKIQIEHAVEKEELVRQGFYGCRDGDKRLNHVCIRAISVAAAAAVRSWCGS